MNLEQAVLAHVQDPTYQPVKPRALANKLGLSAEEVQELRRVIKRLVKRGLIRYGPSHLIAPPGEDGAGGLDSRTITGVFRRTPAGHGYVRPSTVPRDVGRKQDIYISARNSRDAASGDVVLVQLYQRRRPRGPALEGAILQIVERETNRFVGTYYQDGGVSLVRVDGGLFAEPIAVTDPGAKGAQPDDKVVLEMVRFPSHTHGGEGVIVQVLGARGEPGVDTLSIIYEYNLPGDFAPETMEDAREQARRFDEAITGARIDLTHETTVTIDPEDARDFDDAISLKRLPGGHWELGVHIADVAHFVPLRTALDQESRDRATSVYLPDRVIPMLPEIISNNLASLQPDRVRYCLSAMIELTAEGARVGCSIHQTAIKSRRRFTYEEVDSYLADRAGWKKELTPDVHELLGDMHELAMILRQRRLHRGALELNLREVKIDLDHEGRVAGAHLVENTESHQIIEEFMLSANEAVATRLRDEGLFFMRRIHQAPDPRKLESLTEFARELGFKTESLESRLAIQKLLGEVRDLPQEHAVNYAVLRSMQKAIYSPDDEGHYALNSDCYCHFTSPIRRYPDLTVHRLVHALLAGKPPRQDFAELAAQAEHCSQREQRATAAERELTKVKLLDYLTTRIGEEMNGIITGVEEFGLFIQGLELPAEGFVHVSALQDDYYRFDRATHSLTGHRQGNVFRLGDAVRVAVARVDTDRRQLDFRLLGRVSLPAPGKAKHAKRGGKEKKAPPRGIKEQRRASGRKGERAQRPGKKGGKKKGKGKR